MNRNLNIEILKIIAAFMVVAIHTIPLYTGSNSTSDCINMILQGTVRVGLPIFFMISGAFLLTSKINNLPKWYCTRVVTILIPFLIFSYVHYSVSKGGVDFSLSTFSEYFKVLLSSQTTVSGHFWFVYVILGLYLIAPAFNGMIASMEGSSALRTFIIIVVLHSLNSNYQSIQLLTGIPNIFLIPDMYIWLLYFVCGGLLFKCKELLSLKVAWIMIIFGLSATVLLTLITPNKYGLTFQQYDVNVTMLLYCTGVLLLFFNSKFKVLHDNKLFNRIVSFTGKQTYGIYLVHIMVLTFMGKHLLSMVMFLNEYNLNIFITIVCFLFSIAVAFVINLPCNYLLAKVKTLLNSKLINEAECLLVEK